MLVMKNYIIFPTESSFFLHRVAKQQQLGKKKIYMQPAEASISQFLVCYSFHRYMQLKFHIKSLGCHWSQDHNMISCFRIGFNKDSCIMMHLFLFPGNCLNSQQFSNNLKILNIFNDRIQYMPWLLICEHNIPFT